MSGKSFKDYRTGQWETVKIDAGIVDMVREHKEQSGTPMSWIIENAIFEYVQRTKEKTKKR